MHALIFVLGTIVFGVISRNSLLSNHSYGFYRFFAWEILLAMFLMNTDSWFREPLAWYQLISWALLVISIILVFHGLHLIRKIGRLDADRSDPALLGLEKTAHLVTKGLYRYIRHPLYSSLLFLGWGIFFKSPSWLNAGLVLCCTVFLIATAHVEESENIDYFGTEYIRYMQRTKMLIPFVF
jgi:protein-S-isoprenylcysteine O-methyltransferase Ste14